MTNFGVIRNDSGFVNDNANRAAKCDYFRVELFLELNAVKCMNVL